MANTPIARLAISVGKSVFEYFAERLPSASRAFTRSRYLSIKGKQEGVFQLQYKGCPHLGCKKEELKSSRRGAALCSSAPEAREEEGREGGMRGVSFGAMVIMISVALEIVRYYDTANCSAN